jgi:acyl-CoA synthetase (AMP-forming)/AMP-acid ligase II
MLLDRSDKGLVMGPLYHANALWAILLPMLFVGGGFAILRQFEARSVLEAIPQHAVTYTSGTPSMYSLLLADPEIALPSGLLEQLAADRVIGSAAAEHISVMGYQERSLKSWKDKTADEVFAHLRSQGVDGLILAPA